MPPESESAWKRLGSLLAQRRIEIGARFKNKNLFAEEREINRRMVWSVEAGKRDTYTADTLRDVERAYELAPGSIERVLAGGDLEPLGAEPAPRNPFAALAPEEPDDDTAWDLFPDPADKTLRWIWRLPVPVNEREQMVRDHRAWRRSVQEPPGRQSAGLPCAHPTEHLVTFPPLLLIQGKPQAAAAHHTNRALSGGGRTVTAPQRTQGKPAHKAGSGGTTVMLDELHAALERAADLNAQAIGLVEGELPSDGRAVLASALRENRDALVRSVAAVLAAVREEAFAAGRAFERGLAEAPEAPPDRLRLVVNC